MMKYAQSLLCTKKPMSLFVYNFRKEKIHALGIKILRTEDLCESVENCLSGDDIPKPYLALCFKIVSRR